MDESYKHTQWIEDVKDTYCAIPCIDVSVDLNCNDRMSFSCLQGRGGIDLEMAYGDFLKSNEIGFCFDYGGAYPDVSIFIIF